MKPLYWAILGGVVVLLGGYMAWDLLAGPSLPSTSRLISDALSASTLEKRVDAAKRLGMDKRPTAPSGLRRVGAESKDPEVLVVAIGSLSIMNDSESQPLFITALEHEDKTVREAGHDALLRIFGGALPDNLKFQVDDSAEKRGQIARKLMDRFNNPPKTP